MASPKNRRNYGTCSIIARILQGSLIQKVLEERGISIARQCGLDQQWVLNNLKTIAERCLQVAPVLDRKGNQVKVETADGEMAPAFTFDSAGAKRATELVGKHLMMLSDKTVHSGDPDNPIVYAVQFEVA